MISMKQMVGIVCGRCRATKCLLEWWIDGTLVQAVVCDCDKESE